MGIFSKLAFWKKEEPMPTMPDIGGGMDMGLSGLGGGMQGEPAAPGGAEHLGMPELSESPQMPQAPRLQESSPANAEPMHPGYKPPQQTAAPVHHEASGGKDLEIISLKLDSLKTTLEAINERLARLEKMAEGGSASHRF